jgi:hypothetical protein
MGLQVTILAALEKADVGAVQGTLDFRTTSHYTSLLRSRQLSTLLERVRTQFRNPACHGTRTFDLGDYTTLMRLLLTRDQFRTWYRRGPAELDAGILDLHLLELSRRRTRFKRHS